METTGNQTLWRRTGLGISLGLVVLCHIPWLLGWVKLALRDSFYSHILLIPFVSIGLIYRKRSVLHSPWRAAPVAAACLGACAAGIYLWAGSVLPVNAESPPADRLALPLLGLVTLILAVVLAFPGRAAFRVWLFPLLFLYFAVPLPQALVNAIEQALQQATVVVTHGALELFGVPVFREGMFLSLPGLQLEVAEECSGIRSTLVLFITGTLASHLLLRTPWRRVLLVAVIIPLGILRNSLRIVVLATLTIYVDPTVINSPLHHRGGPLFFAAALMVFLGLTILLMRGERRAQRKPPPPKRDAAPQGIL